VLNVDSARVRSVEISYQLLVGRWILKWEPVRNFVFEA